MANSNPQPNIPTNDDDASEGNHWDNYSQYDSDSEDGGMQIEPQIMEFFQGEQEVFYSPHSRHEPRDESQFSSLAPQPDSYLQVDPMDVAMHPQGPPKAIPPRPRMSEEEYAALTVLNDEELLTIYALKSGQTIPQTRRRFQAKLLSGGDLQVEEEMFAARFAVPAAKAHLVPGLSRVGSGPGAPERALDLNNAQAYLVPGSWKEVVDQEEGGWWAPGQRWKGDGGAKRKATSRAGSGEDSRLGLRAGPRN